jgi:hypothetical protein
MHGDPDGVRSPLEFSTMYEPDEKLTVMLLSSDPPMTLRYLLEFTDTVGSALAEAAIPSVIAAAITAQSTVRRTRRAVLTCCIFSP